MKETSFINQNKKKWARFEKLRNNKTNDPDEVSELFTEITEDLSYSRTFYPRRSVRVYLNQLAQGVFTSLYKQRRQPLGNFAKFWTDTVPLEVYRSRHNILTAFLFFMVAALIGAVSQHYDPDFVKIVLGDGYVSDTEQRIREGNPMGVYGEMSQTSMFLYITFNNIRVAFLVFVSGILFNIFTYFLLIQNGIMLGSFQWWFKLKGLLLTSFLTVWIHGAFEISAIVIAGGAGLTVGNGFFFPGSHTRLQSLVFAARRGLVIMMSLIPFFVIAGFLESFVTRYYREIPDILKWAIILLSFAIIFFYYAIYPYVRAKKRPEIFACIIAPVYLLLRIYMKNRETEDEVVLKEVPRFIPQRKLVLYKIRSVGETFTDTFYLFVRNFRSTFSRIAYTSIPLMIGIMIYIVIVDYPRLNYTNLTWWESFGTFFGTNTDYDLVKVFAWPLVFTCIIMFSLYMGYREKFKHKTAELIMPFISLYVFSTAIFALLVSAHGGILFLFIFAVPFLILIPPIMVFEKKNIFTVWPRTFELIRNSYADGLGTFGSFSLIAIIFFWVFANPSKEIFGGEISLSSFIDQIVEMVTITSVTDYAVVIAVVNMSLYLIYILFMLSIISSSFGFVYLNAVEKTTAKGLYDRLEKFGERSRTHEKELDFE
ncbi:MAG: stage II sporulation protein M [Crocinitomicaceae bacterium]|nr:stage II sporulation protein M [Crocinitomicaceae bacterium]